MEKKEWEELLELNKKRIEDAEKAIEVWKLENDAIKKWKIKD